MTPSSPCCVALTLDHVDEIRHYRDLDEREQTAQRRVWENRRHGEKDNRYRSDSRQLGATSLLTPDSRLCFMTVLCNGLSLLSRYSACPSDFLHSRPFSCYSRVPLLHQRSKLQSHGYSVGLGALISAPKCTQGYICHSILFVPRN
jgi:hypothetical protein